MRLVFTGHQGSPRITHVAQAPRRPSYGDSNGTFNHNGSYYQEGEVLNVTFSPAIEIASGLDPATETAVMTHEQQHRRDFVQRAERLRAALQRTVQQRRDPEIDLRWEWFTYDLQEDANRFHQRMGQGDIRPAIPPRRPRPA
jgi:hypothetical protein